MSASKDDKSHPARELDFLAFGPHPDDAEIGCGAFLLKMKGMGYATGIVVLTEGDMGAGTPAVRRREAEAAARGLKVDVFEVMDLGDTRVADTHEQRLAVASMIRKHRSKIVLAPYFDIIPGRGRGHGDHIAAGNLVTHAANFAHLEKYPASGKPHAVRKMIYFMVSPFERPTFIVEVDKEFPEAIKAMSAHESQFKRTDRPVFFPTRLEAFGRYFGALIGAEYGQAFYMPDSLKVNDPLKLLLS
jgi:bacillithiol biosynthesis deacetylase BshB1